ncbi:MAG: 16S rRNA (cytosine(967)-C(5))-methyltransferase RsmB [Enterobacterales bacterium]|nr:16S rRNA (cytosine(967)-C(5))-methyltransferase RsmB [Enterobacterales bacterium]
MSKPSQQLSKSNNQAVTAARLVAFSWLVGVIIHGRSINELLAASPKKEDCASALSVTTSGIASLEPQQRAFAKQLLFGTVRHYHQLKGILDQLLQKAFKQKDQDLSVLLMMGLYQLSYLSTADHAALSQSVEMTRKINKNWASGLVNGVLRQYLRNKQSIEQQLSSANTFRYSHPNWIINQIQQDWPVQADQILQANNQQGPMCLRINTQQISRKDYQVQLSDLNLESKPHPVAQDALLLTKACDVVQLPGFNQGLVTVQDAAPQLVVELLQLQPGLRVLDGCAAPGGKTTHILQRQADVSLVSVELSKPRLQKIRHTLDRMGFDCDLKCADILQQDDWWDGKAFDRILIDVPCTATGVIRRNPDIKIHRTKQDLKNTVALQQKILHSVWSLLKPGGILVYATCSLFKQENERQMHQFLQTNPAEPVVLAQHLATQLVSHSQLGYQILPGEFEMDGFYLCALKKPQ